MVQLGLLATDQRQRGHDRDYRQPIAVLVLAALAGATYKQGGFYAAAQWYLAALISVLAVLAALSAGAVAVRERGVRRAAGWPASAAPLALIGWTLAEAGLRGSVGDGLRLVLLVLGVLAMIAACRCLDAPAVDWLVSSLLLLGALVGLLGWFGVLGHRGRFALPGQGLWRASATLGYPNAAAALLAMLALAGLALGCRQPAGAARRLTGLLVTATLTGLAATLSRGGLLAFAAGALALLAVLGSRRLLATAVLPVLGAALATAGLLPSMPTGPTGSVPHYLVGVLALLAGLALGGWAPANPLTGWLTGRRRPVLLAAAGILGLLGLGLAVLGGRGQARFSAQSADRLAAWHAAWHQIGKHPFTGSGPGLHQLSWSSPSGGLHVFNYAHDEYLQLLAELGLIGLACLAACGYWLVRTLRDQRPALGADRTRWAAAIAAVAVLGISVLFDFTGHFPAIPLTAAALVGCAGPVHRLGNSETTSHQ